jgi:hypothetical protein
MFDDKMLRESKETYSDLHPVSDPGDDQNVDI